MIMDDKVIEIDNREFIVSKVINNYYYCSNINDLHDCCILKKTLDNNEEVYVPLSDEELEEAVLLFNKQ